MYQPVVFPTLQGKSWVQVDLNDLALKDFPQMEENKLLDAQSCDNWVKSIANKLGADFTWGGHFEDRKHLWTGYYTDAEKVTHLGVDYNVSSGTPVAAPVACEVVHSRADTSVHNGWGGRLLLKLDTRWMGAPYLVLGHLAHKDLPPVGARFAAGDIIHTTGVPSENGGWFPHLHVQCVNEDFYQQHIGDLTLLDGYYLVDGDPLQVAERKESDGY